MNVENINRVADAIEAACAPEARPSLGFNMIDFENRFKDLTGHNCRTVCCIAGWATRILAHQSWDIFCEDPKQSVSSEVGSKLFGIGAEDAHQLFIGCAGLNLRDIQPDKAVAVLRHLAETGKVDWTVGAEPSSDA